MAAEDRPPAKPAPATNDADRAKLRDRKAPPFRFTDFAMI